MTSPEHKITVRDLTDKALNAREEILRNGKIRQKITDNSPVKIIKEGYLINIDSDLNCVIKKIFDQKILVSFYIKGISSPEEILDGRCTDDMKNFVYVIKNGVVIYNFKNRGFI